MGTTLLEREEPLDRLAAELAEAARGRGRLVFVSGEAGVGKTVLVARFCAAQGTPPALRGACDALFTPRPLGPLVDVAETVGGELARLAGEGARPHELLPPLLRELEARGPALLVLEDAHWADEATLDVLRLLGRRVDAVPALVVVTLRDDELARDHPLVRVLGELATSPATARLRLEPLSPAAVAQLAEGTELDADELFRRTSGNPFFVTEAIAAGDGGVPPTVRDAVLARAARVGPSARALLEAVAVVPPQAELRLLERLAELDALDECLSSGMLEHGPRGVGFRHELARLALEESIAPPRRLALHRGVLAALAEPAAAPPDLARLAHHAEAAGDGEAVLRYAPAAADRAAVLGAHREAADQLARALRFADALPARERAELLERRSFECYLTGRIDESLAAREEALELFRALGDGPREGEQRCWLARIHAYSGRREEADAHARAAVELLERLPPGRELAIAYTTMAGRRSIALDPEGALEWGERALALAARLGDHETEARAGGTVGTVEALAGRGTARLRRALDLALEHDYEELVSLLYGNLAVVAVRHRSWEEADRLLAEGIRYTTERDFDSDRGYIAAWRASAAVARCRWDEAARDVSAVLAGAGTTAVVRASALLTLGQLRARRGDPDVWEPLDESLAIAREAAELPKHAPLASARAEARLLGGNADAVAAELAPFVLGELADRWIAGELAVWGARAGLSVDPGGPVPEPFALELAGEHAGAAARWAELGCRYDAAFALAGSDDDEPLRRAHDELVSLGARPAAALVARRLRERGARGIARGPRPATRANAARLTPRELDVLRLVADGLRNADVAERLFLSSRTVDHHVSSVLRKLNAATRGEAVAEARRSGLLENGQPPQPT